MDFIYDSISVSALSTILLAIGLICLVAACALEAWLFKGERAGLLVVALGVMFLALSGFSLIAGLW